jgi:hypothetical protein
MMAKLFGKRGLLRKVELNFDDKLLSSRTLTYTVKCSNGFSVEGLEVTRADSRVVLVVPANGKSGPSLYCCAAFSCASNVS